MEAEAGGERAQAAALIRGGRRSAGAAGGVLHKAPAQEPQRRREERRGLVAGRSPAGGGSQGRGAHEVLLALEGELEGAEAAREAGLLLGLPLGGLPEDLVLRPALVLLPGGGRIAAGGGTLAVWRQAARGEDGGAQARGSRAISSSRRAGAPSPSAGARRKPRPPAPWLEESAYQESAQRDDQQAIAV